MIFKRLGEEIDSIMVRDPAAHSRLEVMLCYPGLHALLFYRVAHWAWGRGWRVFARFLSHFAKWLTGIEIHPGAEVGDRLFIDHGTGVVIGETAVIGNDVTLYQGVTLGGTSLHKGKRHPTLEDGVIVGSGAQVLGPLTVGSAARIGANAVVLSDVPHGMTMVGIPAKAIQRPGPEDQFLAYGCDAALPDPVARAIDALRQEVVRLRKRVGELEDETKNGAGGNGTSSRRRRKDGSPEEEDDNPSRHQAPGSV
ncbi:MAG TPA: serine O-acetyltransferase [Rhodospirillaceae bacterium]|nr:serine O-acetyltransferase [Rhodospirillaceae bacterium]